MQLLLLRLLLLLPLLLLLLLPGNVTVCIPIRRIEESALQIVEFDGLRSQSSNLTVGSLNHRI